MVKVILDLMPHLLNPHVALYAEMKEGLLSPQTEYASRPLRDEVKSKFSLVSWGVDES